MNNFQKEFLMNMFLENDHVCTTNKLVVAVANVINENCENIVMFKNVLKQEFNQPSLTCVDGLGLSLTGRVIGFYEQTVFNFTEEDYIAKFKMKKRTLLELVNFLKHHVTSGNISLEKKVHIFIWILVNNCSYNDTGKLFGLHKSSVSYIFHEIATHLYKNMYQFIGWPSKEEQHITRLKVYNRFKFPNCVGFIDACQFKVFSNKNKRNSPDIVLLQAVCDETLMFIDIYVSPIGRIKKNKVFKDSPLSNELKKIVEFENHIIGDSQYRLRKNFITPFTSEELLTSEEMKFNEIHWKTRSYIGHAFELLKEKFRKLNYIDIEKPESIHLLISVSCILHNFILMKEGIPDIKEETISFEDAVTINTNIVKTADEKRQFLCNYINFIEAEDLLS